MFVNNRKEYQERLKKLQELEKKELLSSREIKREPLEKMAS